MKHTQKNMSDTHLQRYYVRPVFQIQDKYAKKIIFFAVFSPWQPQKAEKYGKNISESEKNNRDTRGKNQKSDIFYEKQFAEKRKTDYYCFRKRIS